MTVIGATAMPAAQLRAGVKLRAQDRTNCRTAPTLFDLVEMQDELSAAFGRDVDLVTRRAVERGRNEWRRRSILESLVRIDTVF